MKLTDQIGKSVKSRNRSKHQFSIEFISYSADI